MGLLAFLISVAGKISRHRSGVFINEHEGFKMQRATDQSFPPIDTETRSHVATAPAAYWLSRKDQTLRAWACLENGPLRPTRINGRLAWSVADIKRLLNGGAHA